MHRRTNSLFPIHSRAARYLLKVFAAFALSAINLFAQHAHLNAGARAPQAGEQLYFVNGASFITNSGFILEMPLATNGPYADLYNGAVTFTSLPATLFTGGPAFGHAALGSYLELKTISVQGPTNALFGYWLEDVDFGTADKIFEVPVGTTNGTQTFNLTESDASAGSDPFGHVHGRRFTLSKKGLYTMGFQIIDTSANGPGGAPVHPPSDIFYMYFRAGPPDIAIRSIARGPNAILINVETGNDGMIYQIERTEALQGAATVWAPLGEPHSGHGDLHTFEDPQVDLPHRFYRLKVSPP